MIKDKAIFRSYSIFDDYLFVIKQILKMVIFQFAAKGNFKWLFQVRYALAAYQFFKGYVAFLELIKHCSEATRYLKRLGIEDETPTGAYLQH